MSFSYAKSRYASPAIETFSLQTDAVLCVSTLSFGENGEPGPDPDWDDDIEF